MKKNKFKIFALLLSVFISAELLVRCFVYSNVRSTPRVQNSSLWNQNNGGPLKPNSFVISEYTMIPYAIHANNLGYRNFEDIELTKPENEIRVLLLGDSYTFSEYIDQRYSYPFILEKLLRNHYPNKTIKVINAGKPGTGSFLQYHYFKDFGMDLEPDIILLNFHANDFVDTFREYHSQNSQYNLNKAPQFTSALRKHLSSTAIYQMMIDLYVKVIYLNAIAKTENLTTKKQKKQISKKTEDELYETYAKKIFDLAQSNKMKILQVITPRGVHEDSYYKKMDKKAFNFAIKNQIEVVETIDFIQSNITEVERTLFPMDGHLSRIGNKFLARRVFDKLKKLQWIE